MKKPNNTAPTLQELNSDLTAWPSPRVWCDAARRHKSSPGIKTGMPVFDTIPAPDGRPENNRSSFRDLITITGQPGAGKTQLAFNLLALAIAEHSPCLFLHTETGNKTDLLQRVEPLLAARQALDYPGFRIVDQSEFIELYKTAKQQQAKMVGERHRETVGSGGTAEVIAALIDDLFKRARKVMAQENRDPAGPFLFLDSIHTFPMVGIKDPRLRIDNIVSTLNTLLNQIRYTKATPLTIVAICHTARDIQTKITEELQRTIQNRDIVANMVLHSGKETGGIEYNARAVLYVAKDLERTDLPEGSRAVRVICGKSTNGNEAGRWQGCVVDEHGTFKADHRTDDTSLF